MANPDDRAKILIVDDEIEFCFLLQKYLKDKYRIQVAHEGQEGLRQIRKFQPNCLLLDIRMPNLNGKAVLESLKDSGSDMKVLIVTGSGVMTEIKECLDLGAVDYILKPIDLGELENKIESILGTTH